MNKELNLKFRLASLLVLMAMAWPVWAEDNVVLKSKTVEGVEMTFVVTSEDEKTCSVQGEVWGGTAIDVETAGHLTIPAQASGYTVTAIQAYAFKDCKNLTSVYIPETITIIYGYAFEGCVNIADINFPPACEVVGDGLRESAWYKNQPDGMVYAGNVAYAYKGDLPENSHITIKDGCLGIGYEAFSKVKGLTTITLPESLKRIEGYAFYESGLKEIVIPSNVMIIDPKAFCGCVELEKVTFEGQTDEIRLGAFSRCTSMKTIVRYHSDPSSNVSSMAFYYFMEDRDDESIYDRTVLYVPKGSADSYRSTDPWGLFKQIIEFEPTVVKSTLNPIQQADIYWTIGGVKSNGRTKGIKIVRLRNGVTKKFLY